MNPEVARLRRQSAQRKYRKRLRAVRLLWSVAGVLLLVLVVETLVALSFSPRFWINRLDITGIETLSPGEVIRLTELREHSNYYRTSGSVLAERIRREPRVKSVHVARGAIGTLQIDVTERTAVARIGASRPPLYVDAAGIAFTRPVPPATAVPTVQGIRVTHPRRMQGQRLTSRAMTSVLQCLAIVRKSSSPRRAALPVTSILVAPSGRMMLVLRADVQVLLGEPTHLEDKIWMVEKMIVDASAKGFPLEKLAAIDVRVITAPTDAGASYRPKPHEEEGRRP